MAPSRAASLCCICFRFDLSFVCSRRGWFLCGGPDAETRSVFSAHHAATPAKCSDVDDPYRFPPLLTPFELHLHGEGTNYESYRTLGAHADRVRRRRRSSLRRVGAQRRSGQRHRRFQRLGSHAPSDAPARRRHLGNLHAGPGGRRALQVLRPRTAGGHEQEKCDPYGFFAEVPPRTASIVWPLDNYDWDDAAWMEQRAQRNWLREPVSIYEVHLESWLRGPLNEVG